MTPGVRGGHGLLEWEVFKTGIFHEVVFDPDIRIAVGASKIA